MSRFTSPLVLSPGAGKLWVTDQEIAYEIGKEGSGISIIVPTNFETDLGTIPFWCRWFLNPADATCSRAFVLHDFLCKLPDFSRGLADAILFEALLVLNVPLWKAFIMKQGVAIHRFFKFGIAA